MSYRIGFQVSESDSEFGFRGWKLIGGMPHAGSLNSSEFLIALVDLIDRDELRAGLALRKILQDEDRLALS